MNQDNSFVYDGVEVKKTGRTAVREIKTTPGAPKRQLHLVEITPVKDFDWLKWVDPSALFVIIEK